MAEKPIVPSEASSATDSDQDFEPSAEMMVDDYDDERTMAEEEELESKDPQEDGEEVGNELEMLKNESEMPIDVLIQMFGYNKDNPAPPAPPRAGSEDGTSSGEETDNDDGTEVTATKEDASEDKDAEGGDKKDSNDKNKSSPPQKLLTTRATRTNQLLRGESRETTDDEEEEEFNGEEYWMKTIQVGSSYQAEIPDTMSKYEDVLPYENDDILLWDPDQIDDPSILEYYEKWAATANNGSLNGDLDGGLPMGNHVRDDERALYLLYQCGYKPDEALRRQKLGASFSGSNVFTNGDCDMTPWSEEECRAFEAGLRLHGKDFHQIKHTKVNTRSVGELVHFYYLWKKTERHDVFTSRTRLEKKKYALHPGTTDYMDKFLDEQESLISRSSSPGDSTKSKAEAGTPTSAAPQNNNNTVTQAPASTTPPASTGAAAQPLSPQSSATPAAAAATTTPVSMPPQPVT